MAQATSSAFRMVESATTRRIIAGPSAVEALEVELGQRVGSSEESVMLVAGVTVSRSRVGADVLQIIGPRCCALYTRATPPLKLDAAREVVTLAREKRPRVVVSLGGGTAIDFAKLAADAGANPKITVDDLLGRRSYQRTDSAPATHIAIPTTLAGAEFTAGVGIVDPVRRRMRLVRLSAAPDVIIFDPIAAAETPTPLWASSGIKALDHAVETLYSTQHLVYTDALCVEAIRTLLEFLPMSVRNRLDIAATHMCQLSSWLAMSGGYNVNRGLSHALGHQLMAVSGVPHGLTSCVTLAPVMKHCVRQLTADRLALLEEAFGPLAPDLDLNDVPMECAGKVQSLLSSLGLPTTLRELGVAAQDLPLLIRRTMQDPRIRTHPDSVSPSRIRTVLEVSW